MKLDIAEQGQEIETILRKAQSKSANFGAQTVKREYLRSVGKLYDKMDPYNSSVELNEDKNEEEQKVVALDMLKQESVQPLAEEELFMATFSDIDYHSYIRKAKKKASKFTQFNAYK